MRLACTTALAAAAITSVAGAETVVIDLFAEGAFSEGMIDSGANFTLSLDLGAGTTVDRIQWNLDREAFFPSLLRQMVIVFRDSDAGSTFKTIQGGPATGGTDNLTGGSNLAEVLATGELFIRFHEIFNDAAANPDGTYLEGSTITVDYTPNDDPCIGDFDGSGDVGFADLTQLLSGWGACVGCVQDLDGNDDIGFTDLTALLSLWGDCP